MFTIKTRLLLRINEKCSRQKVQRKSKGAFCVQRFFSGNCAVGETMC
jgi:hypothetical protein